MNCQTSWGQLQGLLDGELEGLQRAKLQSHLAACPSCARHYESLKTIARGLQSLPLYRVSAQFNQKVLLALGLPVNRPALRPWMKAACAAVFLLVSGWTVFLATSAFPFFSPLRIIRGLEFMLHPHRLSLLAQLWVVKAGLVLIHFMPTAEGARRLLESVFGGTQGMLQLLLSGLLAGILIVVLSKNTPKERWR